MSVAKIVLSLTTSSWRFYIIMILEFSWWVIWTYFWFVIEPILTHLGIVRYIPTILFQRWKLYVCLVSRTFLSELVSIRDTRLYTIWSSCLIEFQFYHILRRMTSLYRILGAHYIIPCIRFYHLWSHFAHVLRLNSLKLVMITAWLIRKLVGVVPLMTCVRMLVICHQLLLRSHQLRLRW